MGFDLNGPGGLGKKGRVFHESFMMLRSLNSQMEMGGRFEINQKKKKKIACFTFVLTWSPWFEFLLFA